MTDRAAILAALADLPAATLEEALERPGDLPPAIRLMVPGTRFAGTAFTVRCRLGDNSPVPRAVDAAQPGDVIVIDCGGSARNALWGETATFLCQLKGITGVVTNGSVRDIEAMRAARFPVFAAGVSLRHSVKREPGWTQVPVQIGDVTIHPGDYVVGDADGVIVLPQAEAGPTQSRADARRPAARRRTAQRRAGAGEVTPSPLRGGLG